MKAIKKMAWSADYVLKKSWQHRTFFEKVVRTSSIDAGWPIWAIFIQKNLSVFKSNELQEKYGQSRVSNGRYGPSWTGHGQPWTMEELCEVFVHGCPCSVHDGPYRPFVRICP